MRRTLISIALIAMFAAAACRKEAATERVSSGESSVAASQSALAPEELGALGAEIHKNPSQADALLARRGLTRESFEASIRKLSEDPAASKRYAAEFGKNAK